jgi:pilus assembly protein CpaE
MELTQLLILIAIAAVVFLVLVGVISLIFWRRSRRRKAVAASSPAEAVLDRQLEQLAEPEATAKAPPAKPAAAPAPAKPAAPALKKVTPAPVSSLEFPEEHTEPIRILIVDDNPGTRENVSRLLYFEKDMEVIGQAVNGRQGISMAAELRPHIVLMDINMPDMDGITATKEMSFKTPYSQVIIMSVQAEPHYMKQAMAAGARDFQPKPFTADELISCIRRVYQIGLPLYRRIESAESAGPVPPIPTATGGQARTPAGKCPVFAVYSGKGGIGTSALAVNLAIAFQQTAGNVALMDADFQFGDISVHLNMRPDRTVADAIHDNKLDQELISEVMLAHNSGLKLLLAPPQPELADAITPEMVGQIIKTLRTQYNLVVIDTASQLTDRTLTVLDNADHVLLVTGPELPAIKSAKLFLELAPQLEFSTERIEVIMNRANQPGGIPVDKIEKALKLKRSFHVPYDPRIHTAINKGVAVTLQDTSAPSAKAIRQIAVTLWQKISASETTAKVQEAA